MPEHNRKTIHDDWSILPPEIQEVGFDFARDFTKLHALELPVEELDIQELEWHLDLSFFWQPDQPFSLKPREVLEHPDQYEYRMSRIMGVDTGYPIDTMWWKGRWQILDGLHRLCQLIVKGEKVARVRKVPPEWKELIIPN